MLDKKPTLNEILKKYIDLEFRVIVGGELERKTGFIGLMKLLHYRSGFYQWTPAERKQFLYEGLKTGWLAIDADVSLRFKKI